MAKVESTITGTSPATALTAGMAAGYASRIDEDAFRGGFSMPLKKTLVINPSHPLVQNAWKLWEGGVKKDLARKLVTHVQDMATLSSEGLTAENKEAFVKRSQTLVQELSTLAI